VRTYELELTSAELLAVRDAVDTYRLTPECMWDVRPSVLDDLAGKIAVATEHAAEWRP